ncbi:MAG: hypothetical protein JW810_10240, partial [Sedimentisphaerales bacterium]|nr:hypothetical protein [Sedimentisphaerales bacterium]
MPEFIYLPDEQIHIHRENAIKHMCQPFLSHENGLPEWVKNSAAAYIRENHEHSKRAIVLVFATRQRSKPASIACLDFVGMTSTQIEEDFRRWADPEAAIRRGTRGVAIGELGGHGNGGKCYMTQMFDEYAFLQTSRYGLCSAYGVKSGSVAFGYVPNPQKGKDFPIRNITEEVDSCLNLMRANVSNLPDQVKNILKEAGGFTFIQGVSPRYWEERDSCQKLIESLLGHHQMITPLQQCQVYIIMNGSVYNGGKPLGLPRIDPMIGYENPRVLNIPETLRDPVSNQSVSTTHRSRFAPGELRIHTSEKNMRLGRGGKRQWRHTVTYHTKLSGVIGKIQILSLDVDSTYRDHVYCECFMDALDEFQQNNRGPLAESPLTRSVDSWIASQVRAICREFEDRDKRLVREQDKNELSRLNDWLDQWKNQFLQDFMQGLFGQGEGAAAREGTPLPSGKPTRIEVALNYPRAGKGVYFRPTVRFFDSQNRQIRPVPYKWRSDDNNVAMVDDELMQVQTFSFGQTTITAETLDGTLCSNAVSLEVVRILAIRVAPHELEMPAGTRRKLEAMCQLDDSEEVSNVYLTWIESNAAVARVSGSGLVYAFGPGVTEVTALDESCRSDVAAIVKVTPSTGKGQGKNRGRGFPRILISEVDCAPGEDRPRVLRIDDPPIHQPLPIDVDNNIWWINLASPFARMYYE